MRNSPLALLSSLLLVPSGLCSPRVRGGLERRATAAPKDACPAGPVKDKTPIWVPRAGLSSSDANMPGSISVQVGFDDGTYTGYFVLNADLGDEQGVWAGTNRLGNKDKTDLDIQPYFDVGLNTIKQENNINSYTIWIDSQAAPGPNYAKDLENYAFPGVFPRVDMQIDSAANADYYVVQFSNPVQGATYVGVENITAYHCGTAA